MCFYWRCVIWDQWSALWGTLRLCFCSNRILHIHHCSWCYHATQQFTISYPCRWHPTFLLFKNLKSPIKDFNDILKCITGNRTWMIMNTRNYFRHKVTHYSQIPQCNFLWNSYLSFGHERMFPSSNCKSLGTMFDDNLMSITACCNKAL